MATRSHERSTARRSAARTGAAARPYEDEICARDGTGRITYRIEHVARAGATGAMLRDAIGWRYEYTGDRLLRATRYQTGARSCADFVASGGAGVPTDGTATMTYGPNGVVTGGTSVHCPAAQYDAADRPTCRGRQYDDRGQLSRCTGERFTYDVLGRLRSHSQRSTTSTYDWDAAGRLVGMSAGAHDEHFVYGSGMGPIAWRRDGATAYFA